MDALVPRASNRTSVNASLATSVVVTIEWVEYNPPTALATATGRARRPDSRLLRPSRHSTLRQQPLKHGSIPVCLIRTAYMACASNLRVAHVRTRLLERRYHAG